MSRPYSDLSELQLRLLLVLKDLQADAVGRVLQPCSKDLARELETPLHWVETALQTLMRRGFVTQLPNGLRAEVPQ